MELLEVLETVRAEEASVQRLFGGEGTGMRSVPNRENPAYMRKLAEAATLLSNVRTGRWPDYYLREAMSSSDFPYLFGDILDRTMLSRYTYWEATWPAIANVHIARDFRDIKRFLPHTGLEGELENVAELAEYQYDSLTEQAPITYAVQKMGRKAAISWETLINDDLGSFDGDSSIPTRFAAAARVSEELAITRLYVDANGPHASMYTTGNKNRVHSENGALDDNTPFSIEGLQDAYKVLGAMVDETGRPIQNPMFTLVVPPALEVTANNLLNATSIELRADAGTDNQRLSVVNWMRSKLRLVVNPYIPLVATNANGNTSWFLFATPGGGNRPAIEMAFLRGYEQPQIFMKDSNQRRVGGGAANILDGSFENDAIEYKVRHVFGATRIDAKRSVASNGSSS